METKFEKRRISRLDGTGRGITAAWVSAERRTAHVVSESDGLRVYDLDKGSWTQSSPESLMIRGLTPSPWSSYFAAWGDSLFRWGGSGLPSITSPFPLNSAVPLEDGRTVAGSFLTNDLLLLPGDTRPNRRIPFHSAPITQVMCGRRTSLVSASLDGTLGVWDPRAISPMARLEGHTDGVLGCLFIDDLIVSYSADKTLRSWSWASARGWSPLAVMSGHTGEITAVAVLPGKSVASSSRDGTVRVWNVQTGEQTLEIPASSGWVTLLATSPNGQRIAAASDDQVLRLWDARGKELGVFPGANPFTTLGMTDDLICAGDNAGNFWMLDYGPILEKVTLPARIAALVVDDNMALAGDIAKYVQASPTENIAMEPVNVDRIESADLNAVLAPFPIVVLFACNSMRDSRYDDLVDRLLRRSVGNGHLIVTFEDPRLWRNSFLAKYATLDWPNQNALWNFGARLGDIVAGMSAGTSPLPP